MSYLSMYVPCVCGYGGQNASCSAIAVGRCRTIVSCRLQRQRAKERAWLHANNAKIDKNDIKGEFFVRDVFVTLLTVRIL